MSTLRIGVAGATGALGKEILAVLDKTPWRPDTVRAYASARSSVPSVDYGDQSLPVDDIGQADLEDLDAIVLAVPADVARELGERAVGDGVAVVDASGVFAEDEDVPLVVPWVNPEVVRELPPRGILAAPTSEAIAIASILGPLRRAGLTGVARATVMVPASAEGREGIEELSRQVVALFNSATPPRKVFQEGLAFDLLSEVGQGGADGWTDRERRVAAEVARVAGVPADVTMVRVPLFSGLGLTLTVDLGREVALEKVAQVLAEGGVVVPKAAGTRHLPRPRKVEGHPFAHVGRVRQDAHGGLHLWVSFDNLRGAATVAVGCAALLLRDRIRKQDRGDRKSD